jgi:hypothetical protein
MMLLLLLVLLLLLLVLLLLLAAVVVVLLLRCCWCWCCYCLLLVVVLVLVLFFCAMCCVLSYVGSGPRFGWLLANLKSFFFFRIPRSYPHAKKPYQEGVSVSDSSLLYTKGIMLDTSEKNNEQGQSLACF